MMTLRLVLSQVLWKEMLQYQLLLRLLLQVQMHCPSSCLSKQSLGLQIVLPFLL
jgi:hypothetical protein